MKLLIPPILDLEINALSACAIVKKPTSELLKRLSQSKGSNNKEAIYDGSNWIHVNSGLLRIKGLSVPHLHIDIVRKPPYWNPEQPRKPNSTLDKVLGEIDHFKGLLLHVRGTCRFLVLKETIPKSGLLYSILGLSTKAMHAKLNLVEAKMAIHEAPPYNVIEWRIETEDENHIGASLAFSKAIKLDRNYLVKVADIARKGIDRFLLERRG